MQVSPRDMLSTLSEAGPGGYYLLIGQLASPGKCIWGTCEGHCIPDRQLDGH